MKKENDSDEPIPIVKAILESLEKKPELRKISTDKIYDAGLECIKQGADPKTWEQFLDKE